MIGKQFTNCLGKNYTKLEVFNEYKNNPGILKKIVNGNYSDLRSIDKEGWEDGILTDRRSYSRTGDGRLILV
jgi:hypothetical protein